MRSLKNLRKLIKKRIVVTEIQKKIIKKRMSQGFSSQLIAEEIELPVAVVRRYYNAVYFKVEGRQTCSKCGAIIKKNTICSGCHKKASLISDDGFYAAVETAPSEMINVEINSKLINKKG